MTRPLQKVREAAIDGRAQNYYYRQKQLRNLHTLLVQNASGIQSAIGQDAGCTIAEAQLEYLLALSCLREHYAQLHPEKALEEEYSVARGVDAPNLREGVGLVYIQPTSHTLFFSVIAPLAAAVAAGNVVVLQLENTTRSVSIPALLRKLLKQGLDPDTIEIVSSKPPDDQLGAKYIQVLQNGLEETPKANQLISLLNARVVAVVDRTANLQSAAKALVTARFSFGGRSPYAPDLVLVNEFSRKQFLDAVVAESIRFMTESHSNGNVERNGGKLGVRSELEMFKDADDVRVVTSGANGSILEAQNRSSSALSTKIRTTALLIHSIRSLDDAIDVANINKNLLASYIFAAPTSAKYLSQFISAPASFINYVPFELLIGPAAPSNPSFPLDAALRYPADLFSIPRPAFAKPSRQSAVFLHGLADSKAAEVRTALVEASKELKPESTRQTVGQIGFFEQGILTGLGIFLVPTLLTLATAGFYGVKAAKSRWW